MNTSERAAHPSKAQIHALLNVLENTQSLAKGFSKNPSARDAARRTWEKLAVQLNSLEGCVKTWKQWTKYWADKKSAVKKKAALRSISRNNGGVEEVVELSEIEERILTIMGGYRHLETSTFFEAHDEQSPENILVPTRLIGQNLSLPMEMRIVEDSEQSGSDHGAGPNFARFQESIDNQLLENSRESNSERPVTSTCRKRRESNTDPLLESFPILKLQRGTQFTIPSENEAVRECDLYGQLLAQKLKQLDTDDRLVLMNNIDNLVFKYLTNIRRRNNLSRNGQLPSMHQRNSDDSQSIELPGSSSQDCAQNNMLNSESKSEVLCRLKTETDT